MVLAAAVCYHRSDNAEFTVSNFNLSDGSRARLTICRVEIIRDSFKSIDAVFSYTMSPMWQQVFSPSKVN